MIFYTRQPTRPRLLDLPDASAHMRPIQNCFGHSFVTSVANTILSNPRYRIAISGHDDLRAFGDERVALAKHRLRPLVSVQ
jgi:hypothetical protein